MEQIAGLTGALFVRGGASGMEKAALTLSKLGLSASALERVSSSITDFGISTTLTATSFTKTNSVLGTVHYLSPEQARGGIATKKSDIYALGIVLYELLTGELPFSGESAVSIALKHLQTETPSVRAIDASIPQALENVVLKATAKNPAHRYNTVEEMEEDLDSALSQNRLN